MTLVSASAARSLASCEPGQAAVQLSAQADELLEPVELHARAGLVRDAIRPLSITSV